MENAQQDTISAAVNARVKSFEAAERARDPEKLLAHYASVPEFHFYHDGRRANYEVMAAGVEGSSRRAVSRSHTVTFKSQYSAQTARWSVLRFVAI